MKEQGNTLASKFENWKKDLDQINDVALIGVRL